MQHILLITKWAELPFHINLCGSNFRFYGQSNSNLYRILTFPLKQFLTCSLCFTTASIPHLRFTPLAILHALMFQMIFRTIYNARLSIFLVFRQMLWFLACSLCFTTASILTCSLCFITASIPHLRVTTLATLLALMFQILNW